MNIRSRPKQHADPRRTPSRVPSDGPEDDGTRDDRKTGGAFARFWAGSFAFIVTAIGALAVTPAPRAQEAPAPLEIPPASLKSVKVPGPSAAQLAEFVEDKQAAIALGKALFWDTNLGSDNATACASCHFHAGADSRSVNSVNPGLIAGDKSFQLGGPNYSKLPSDFPFTNGDGPESSGGTFRGINDITGAQGVFTANFDGHGDNGAPDACTGVLDDVAAGGNGFFLHGLNTRQVTGRNSPTVINAVFNFRNFWDGRANNVFNGGDPFGMRNPNALVWKLIGPRLRQVKVRLPSSSLASQASGPPLSAVEMSCLNRSFMKLGKKMLQLQPLASQQIHSNDSVLGFVERWRKSDPRMTYADLVKRSFRKEYWRAPASLILSPNDEDEFGTMDLPPRRVAPRTTARFDATQMEANFALFFSLAVQLYESTLVSDDTRFDRYLDGSSSALTAQEIRGFEVFAGPGKCLDCHSGPELTAASFDNVKNERLERMVMGDGGVAVYDNGFYNIGVRPTSEDPGVGGTDPFGNPLSETRMAQLGRTHLLGNGFDATREPRVGSRDRIAVMGAFKTPGLRNVEFTGPYFHNGGQATLMQVVDFYDRGGNFPQTNRANLDPDIQPLGLSQSQKDDLVAFMLALSDDRVRYRRAPFDHPSICIPHGHLVDGTGKPQANGTGGTSKDDMRCLPAIGRNGAPTGLARYLNLDPFSR